MVKIKNTKIGRLKKQLHKLNRVKGKDIHLSIFYDPEYDNYFLANIGEYQTYGEFTSINNVEYVGYYDNRYCEEYNLGMEDRKLDEDIKNFMENDLFVYPPKYEFE